MPLPDVVAKYLRHMIFNKAITQEKVYLHMVHVKFKVNMTPLGKCHYINIHTCTQFDLERCSRTQTLHFYPVLQLSGEFLMAVNILSKITIKHINVTVRESDPQR